jgi:hypothetical protein
MDKQCGGAKLKADAIDSPGFKPVYDMVIHENSKLSVLTTNSLKGFMINLTVDSTESKYLNLRGMRFTNPVTNFILKFVILRGKEDFTDLEPYEGIHKSFETPESFFEEAKFQQDIWKRSIIGGRPAICPSVANLSMFDTINSANLIWFFSRKVKQEPSSSVFKFLLNNSKINGRGIGILTMPAITQSTTLHEFSNLPDNSVFFGKEISYKHELYVVSFVFAQIVRLFIEIGVIHFDLHAGNVMVYLTPDKKQEKALLKTALIDFGRASNIMSDEPDSIFSNTDLAKKIKIRANKIFFNNLFLNSPPRDTTAIEKLNYMKHVLAYIAETEKNINNPKYYKNDGVRYQMKWYEKYIVHPEVFVFAFNILDTMTRINVTKTGINLETIHSYERDGSFINLNNPEGIDAFIVPYPGPMRNVPPPSRVPLPPPPPASRISLPPPPASRVSLPPSPPMEPVPPEIVVEMKPTDSSIDDEALDNNHSHADVESLQPNVEMEPVQSNVNAESLQHYVDIESTKSSMDDESLTTDYNSSVAQVESLSGIDANSLPPPRPRTSKRPNEQVDPSTGADAELRAAKRLPPQGGSKNKHHKTNKRKKCKSKKNRRNKNKNTRKKRKN